MSCESPSSSSSRSRSPSAPTEPTVPRLRSANSRARASRSSQSRRACSASGSRSLRSQRTPVALREELTATARERIWPFIAVPYLMQVSRRLHWTVLGLSLAVGAGIGAVIAIARSSSAAPATRVANTGTPATLNRNLDPGTPLSAVAPGFTLTDQFGKRVSLRSFRGKVVIVSFNDPECTTICPLTTTALLHAKKLLGPAASRVELLGIGANPDATEVKWVRDYSRVHGMLHKWRFLTGSLAELKRVWRAYGIAAEVMNDIVDHTPATFVIGPNGRESRLFETAMAYSSANQLGYEIAQSIGALLAGHPHPHGAVSLAEPVLHGPRDRVRLPRAGGGTFPLGPGSGAHLVLFFDTWETEVTDLRAQLEALNRYQAAAKRRGL